jgi:preprotein translocase subunit SecG
VLVLLLLLLLLVVLLLLVLLLLQAGAGVGYSSKLDDFDVFVTRCKFAALPLKSSQQPQGE